MWAAVAILALIAILFWMYLVLEAERHEREELERIRKEIKDAEAELDKALQEPENYAYHRACKCRLERLREQEDALR